MAAVTRALAGRAVHLRITPRPSNLGESREILRLLSGFGEIEYYKSLRYDALSHPNAAYVIYKDAEAAKQCLKKSPIRFRMGKAVIPQPAENEEVELEEDVGTNVDGLDSEVETRRGPSRTPFGMAAPRQRRAMSTSAVTNASAEGYRPFGLEPGTSQPGSWTQPTSREGRRSERFYGSHPFSDMSQTAMPPPRRANAQPKRRPEPAPVLDPDARMFQITTNLSRRNFRDHVNVNHYHGNFALDTKTFAQAEMARKVPLPGLSCLNWKHAERPWHVVKEERERDSSGVMKRRTLGEIYREAHGEQSGPHG